jgi:hypothetical protein
VKPKLIKIIFEHSVCTPKKTQYFSITEVSWWVLFREIINVFSEDHTKPINTFCGQSAEVLIVKTGGTYSYHWALKD